VLNLEVPPEDVDVNVHPTKKEVRYKNTNQIFNFIHSAIDGALSSRIEREQESKKEEFVPKETSVRAEIQKDEIEVDISSDISSIFAPKSFETESNEKIVSFPKRVVNTEPTYFTPKQSKLIEEKVPVAEDVIIGQYKKTYILIEREEGLEIVDQHIAEERFIYEQLKKSKNIDCQLLFISDVLEISPSDKELLETNKDKLEKFGYQLDFISDHEVIFRKVPQILSRVAPKDILADILEHISGDIDNIEEQILITTSCKAAVKANTYLNQFQMQEIIRNWRTCEKPFTCPHGRPISHIIEHKDLAKFFQRNK
jgi:DNA mismatch repair protein MutL